MRVRLIAAVAVVMCVSGPSANAHPLGTPPLAEINFAGAKARTTLTLAPDDTVLLLTSANAPLRSPVETPGDVLATQSEVVAYLATNYRLSIPSGPCAATVAGGRYLPGGTGFRFLIDHTCPADIGDVLGVHSELLRELSPAYKLEVAARVGSTTRTYLIDEGETDADLDLTAKPGASTDKGEAPAREARDTTRSTSLRKLFSFLDEGRGLGSALVAFAIAALLGALHGLTPGHGKTLVAAYLAGSDAKVRHAFAVGAALTLTHTAAVLGFGLLALVAGRTLVPSRVEPILSAIAAALVVGIGLWMIFTRTRNLIRRRTHAHDHDHDHPVAKNISARGIVAVGLAGGVIPCPEAFGILFVALTIGRVLAGMFILIGFSLGLAAVLVAVSLALVLSRRAIAPTLERSRVVRYLPVVSAVLITGIGVFLGLNALSQF